MDLFISMLRMAAECSSSESVLNISVQSDSLSLGELPKGAALYSKLAALVNSDAHDALEELSALCKQIDETPLQEQWDSGDELSDASRVPAKAAKYVPFGSRIVKIDAPPERKNEKTRVVARAAPTFVPEKVVVDLSDDEKSTKTCHRCLESSSSSSNPLLPCESCSIPVHAHCNRPPVKDSDHSDPRFIFTCDQCVNAKTTREDSPKPIQSIIRERKRKDDGLRPANVAATFEAFKKKKEMKANKTALRK